MKNKICEQDPQKHVMCEQVSIFATQITLIKLTIDLPLHTVDPHTQYNTKDLPKSNDPKSNSI